MTRVIIKIILEAGEMMLAEIFKAFGDPKASFAVMTAMRFHMS